MSKITEERIQEVFNTLIAEGYYKNYMCDAVNAAYYDPDGPFTDHTEADLVLAEIEKYLRKPYEDFPHTFFSLECALIHNNLPSDYETRLAIYKDWENKPKLEGQANESKNLRY